MMWWTRLTGRDDASETRIRELEQEVAVLRACQAEQLNTLVAERHARRLAEDLHATYKGLYEKSQQSPMPMAAPPAPVNVSDELINPTSTPPVEIDAELVKKLHTNWLSTMANRSVVAQSDEDPA